MKTLDAMKSATKKAVGDENKVTSEPEDKNVTSWAEEVKEEGVNCSTSTPSLFVKQSSPLEEVILGDQKSDTPNVCESSVDAAELAAYCSTSSAKRRHLITAAGARKI